MRSRKTSQGYIENQTLKKEKKRKSGKATGKQADRWVQEQRLWRCDTIRNCGTAES